MTFETVVRIALEETFPECNADEIISRACPHHFFKNVNDDCNNDCCVCCWGREIEEATE